MQITPVEEIVGTSAQLMWNYCPQKSYVVSIAYKKISKNILISDLFFSHNILRVRHIDATAYIANTNFAGAYHKNFKKLFLLNVLALGTLYFSVKR